MSNCSIAGSISPTPSCNVAGVASKVLISGWPLGKEMR